MANNREITDWEDVPLDEVSDWKDVPLEQPRKSEMESAIRGAAQSASLGFVDEATGAIEALWNKAKGNPDEFSKLYKQFRDESREEYKQAKEDNSGAYLAGEIGGGVATALVPGLNVAKGATLAKTIGQTAIAGGLYGMGSSDADRGADILIDTAAGAGLGAAGGAIGYGVIKGVGKVVDSIPDSVKHSVAHPIQTAKAVGRGAKAGAREAAQAVGDTPFLKQYESAVGAIKGGLNEITEAGATHRELSEIAKQARQAIQSISSASDEAGNALVPAAERSKVGQFARKILKPLRAGESGAVGEMTDEDAILAAVLSDGDNPVKTWLAQKSAMLNPGAGSSDDYLKVLSIPSDARAAARAFDPNKAAKELVPDVEAVEELFNQARAERFTALQDAAREAFDAKTVPQVLGDIKGAIDDANRLKSIPGSIRNLLDDVSGIIADGKGTKLQKLTPGPHSSAAVGEQFNRLQKARELLDNKITWASNQGESQAESLLRGVRDSIDNALKTSPDKVQGDALWQTSKQLEDRFFETTKFGRKGSRDVDADKIKTLLGDNPSARRFSRTMQEMREWANQPDLDPKFRDQMNAVIKSIEEKVGVADQQRALNSFRYKQGPSSPAIERLQSAVGKQSLVSDAVNAPAGFLNSADEFNKALKNRIGKSYQQLSPQQQTQAVKVWTWLKANPGAAPEQVERVWRRFLGN